MKQLVLIGAIATLLSAMSCGPLYDPNANNHAIYKAKTEYSEVVLFPVANDGDTIPIGELRFYHIKSSFDSQRLMYHFYGKWTERYQSKNEQRLNQLVWEDVDLINDSQTYTIIADGTETRTEYFASIMVFDANNNDCLIDSNPKKDAIVNHLISMMKTEVWHDSDFFEVKD